MSKREPKLGPSEPRDGEASPSPAKDLVLVGGRVEETGGYRVLRQRADRVEVGELRTLEHGKALRGEVVRLHPTEAHDRVFECETLHDATPKGPPTADDGAGRVGPAQVASDTYRRNWEQIFGTIARELDAGSAEDDNLASATDLSKLN